MQQVDDVTHGGPPVPAPRGPLSEAVVDMLTGTATPRTWPAAHADPFGDDLQLALYTCYELHYRGFAGVDPGWEWQPELLRARATLEEAFLAALRDATPGGDDAGAALAGLLEEDVDAYGVSHHLRDAGTWSQLRDYVAIRSTYHLKEADPHAWVIPRLTGRAKAGLVAVEYDEFGGGRAERMHARLFAELMAGLGLDPRYGRYLDAAPAEALATVNLMSMSGLHRRLRGVLVGHFAAAEITTPPSAARIAAALERLGAEARCVEFFTEHVEADAVHEQVMRREVVGGLLDEEPGLAPDVVFGVQATELLEERLGGRLLASWRAGRGALREPAPEPTPG
ncbi:MAG: iron-containing redox enzyme family protein [Streptosporangiales bacterium]|nr:iron-containing redox enzyme family protein [Streptosporangiales bacterium]